MNPVEGASLVQTRLDLPFIVGQREAGGSEGSQQEANRDAAHRVCRRSPSPSPRAMRRAPRQNSRQVTVPPGLSRPCLRNVDIGV